MRIVSAGLLIGAFLFTGGLGVFLILGGSGAVSVAPVGVLAATTWGTAVSILCGCLLCLVALHFAALVIRWWNAGARFVHEDERGRIEVSPHALSEFIRGVLRQEIGIERFSVGLRHRDEAIGIRVRTTLTPEETVAEVGRRIQETLSRRVTERTGVVVDEVSVLVSSIRPHERRSSVAAETHEHDPHHADC